jgi:hypothetical protein
MSNGIRRGGLCRMVTGLQCQGLEKKPPPPWPLARVGRACGHMLGPTGDPTPLHVGDGGRGGGANRGEGEVSSASSGEVQAASSKQQAARQPPTPGGTRRAARSSASSSAVAWQRAGSRAQSAERRVQSAERRAQGAGRRAVAAASGSSGHCRQGLAYQDFDFGFRFRRS